MTLEVVVFIFGAILLSIALLGGNFQIGGHLIVPQVSLVIRRVSAVIGVLFIGISLWLANRPNQNPATVAPGVTSVVSQPSAIVTSTLVPPTSTLVPPTSTLEPTDTLTVQPATATPSSTIQSIATPTLEPTSAATLTVEPTPTPAPTPTLEPTPVKEFLLEGDRYNIEGLELRVARIRFDSEIIVIGNGIGPIWQDGCQVIC